MALPEWNKVFTWSDGPDLGLIHWAGTDGINIYFLWRPATLGTAGNYSVYKYDVEAQTVTELVSRNDLEADGYYYEFYNNMFSVDLFQGYLYLTLYYDAVLGGFLDEPHLVVFYIAGPGRWQPVYDVDITGETFDEPRMYANSDYIAITAGAMGGIHSVSGLGWADSTGVNPAQGWNYGLDYDNQGIYYAVSGTTYTFNGGVWSVHYGPVGALADGYELWNIGPTKFWTREDAGTYTEDYSTWYHPSSRRVMAIGRNLPYQVTLKTDDRTFGRITGTTTWTDDSELEGSDTISTSNDKRPRMIRLNNGHTYLICVSSGATGSHPKWSFWRRSVSYASTPAAHGGVEESGLYTASADFSNLGSSSKLKKVREISQFGKFPYQRNFQVSTNDNVYLGNRIGAADQQVGRLQPPYTGPDSSLDATEDLTDSISDDDIYGVDLTDVI